MMFKQEEKWHRHTRIQCYMYAQIKQLEWAKHRMLNQISS